MFETATLAFYTDLAQVAAGLSLGLLAYHAANAYRGGTIGRGMRWVAAGLVVMALANLGVIVRGAAAAESFALLGEGSGPAVFGVAVFGGFIAAALGFGLLTPRSRAAPEAAALPLPAAAFAHEDSAASPPAEHDRAQMRHAIDRALARIPDPWVVLALRARLALADRMSEREQVLAWQEVLFDAEGRAPGGWKRPTPNGRPPTGAFALFAIAPDKRLAFVLGETAVRLRALLGGLIGDAEATRRLQGAGLGPLLGGSARVDTSKVRPAFEALLADDRGLGRPLVRRLVEQACRDVGARVPLSAAPGLFDLLPEECLVAERVQHTARSALWEEFLSARREVEQALSAVRQREADEYAESFVRGALDAVLAVDESGTVTFANPAAERLFGVSREGLCGRAAADLLPGYRAEIHSGLFDAVGGGKTRGRVVEMAARRPGGAEVPVEVALSATRRGEQQVVVAVVRDLAERRRQEAALREMREQAERSERLASLGQLAAGVGHEINNPASFVMANLETLRRAVPADGEPPPRAAREGMRELVDEALDGMRRIRDIVRDLQNFARAREASPVVSDLDAIVDSSLRIARVQTRARSRVVRERAPAPPVRADPVRLGQVVVNLLANAAQALPEGAASEHQITVRTGSAPGGAFVEVADDGRGIAPDVLPRIFDPFFTTKGKEGTGLGLFVSRQIVEGHGGRIEARSEPGRGTTFRVWLPAARATDRPAAQAPGAAPRRALRILLVDDEPSLLRGYRRALAPEHDVVTAGSGREAAETLARDDAFDVVVCDLHMPDLAGFDLYGRMRQERPELAARFVFMSGGAMSAEAAEFVRGFSRDHAGRLLAKPLSPEELDQALQRVVAARGAGGPAASA